MERHDATLRRDHHPVVRLGCKKHVRLFYCEIEPFHLLDDGSEWCFSALYIVNQKPKRRLTGWVWIYIALSFLDIGVCRDSSDLVSVGLSSGALTDSANLHKVDKTSLLLYRQFRVFNLLETIPDSSNSLRFCSLISICLRHFYSSTWSYRAFWASFIRYCSHSGINVPTTYNADTNKFPLLWKRRFYLGSGLRRSQVEILLLALFSSPVGSKLAKEELTIG